MKRFNNQKPLVSLHIPKCAGQSFLACLNTIGEGNYKIAPYYPEIGWTLTPNWNMPSTIVHGHFVRWKGCSVEDVCIGASQFTTVLRNPFDVIVSAFFYGIQHKHEWATSQSLDAYLDWWLCSGHGPLTGALLHVADGESVEEYANRFLLIGVVGHMNSYTEQLGALLGAKIPPANVVNSSEYFLDVPDREAEFRLAMPFDFELYEYVSARCA